MDIFFNQTKRRPTGSEGTSIRDMFQSSIQSFPKMKQRCKIIACHPDGSLGMCVSPPGTNKQQTPSILIECHLDEVAIHVTHRIPKTGNTIGVPVYAGIA